MRWPHTVDKAREMQESLRNRVRICPLIKPPDYIAGIDAAFLDDRILCAACLYKYPELIAVEEQFTIEDVRFPYIPGYLSFREGPSIVKTIRKLKTRPGLILFDGQGIAHPRGLGIASHIGVLFDIPSIGSAKSRLVGDYEEPGEKKGDWTSLYLKGDVVGAVLRTKDHVRPLFVSPGHRIDIRGAIDIVLACAGKYRIPEPLRMADIMSKKIKTASNLDRHTKICYKT